MKKYYFPSRKISYFTLTAVLLATAFCAYFYAHPFFYVLLLIELCLPVYSYVLTRYAFGRLGFTLQAKGAVYPLLAGEDAMASAGGAAGGRGGDVASAGGAAAAGTDAHTYLMQGVTFDFHIINPTKLPLSSLSCNFHLVSGFYDQTTEEIHTFSLGNERENTLSLPYVVHHYARYEARIGEIFARDFMHLFTFHRTVDLQCEYLYLPEAGQELPKLDAIEQEGFDEYEETEQKGMVSSNVTDIREYRPGDRLQKIHWKLSQKIGKWMVKENENTASNQFFVLTELYSPMAQKTTDTEASAPRGNRPRRSDAIAEHQASAYHALDDTLKTAYCVCQAFLAAGEQVLFGYYSVASADFMIHAITCTEDLQAAFTQCYFCKAYDTEGLALDTYTRAGLNKGTVIHVTHEGIKDDVAT